ncbi:hypothetical protein [Streptococcus plurextorum]|uniref:hypothetical protein n=1 Tax=Streptococcus plurextorum TaxID=456876 RepID=UPI00055AFF05|nr:hypothetical protein [Streptococcus plurextorum]
MKQVSKLILLVIGGLMLVVLSGCDERNSREWLENKFGTELSRVYPTKNLEDLFEEFPDGFEIKQSRFTEYGLIRIELYGDSSTKTISGHIVEIENDKEVSNVSVSYQNKQFTYSDEVKAKELWSAQDFLFQHLTINESYLSRLSVVDKDRSFQNGDMRIIYDLTSSEIIDFLGITNPKGYTVKLGGSESNAGYYYSVVIENRGTNYRFSERISGTNN